VQLLSPSHTIESSKARAHSAEVQADERPLFLNQKPANVFGFGMCHNTLCNKWHRGEFSLWMFSKYGTRQYSVCSVSCGKQIDEHLKKKRANSSYTWSKWLELHKVYTANLREQETARLTRASGFRSHILDRVQQDKRSPHSQPKGSTVSDVATEPETVEEGLEVLFPIGQLVEMKKTEFVDHQGRVVSYDQLSRGKYLVIDLEVYKDGRRRSEDKVKQIRCQFTSAMPIDEYRPEPTPKAETVAAEAEDESEDE